MSWNQLFPIDKPPTFSDIQQFLGEKAVLWTDLLAYLEKAYQVKPNLSFSKCAAQPGWNVLIPM